MFRDCNDAHNSLGILRFNFSLRKEHVKGGKLYSFLIQKDVERITL